MQTLDMRPEPIPSRGVNASRSRACWPAMLPSLAVALDACWPITPGAGALGLLWLDLAALACVAWAAFGPRRARPRDWFTPVDGRIVAGVVLALLHVIASGAASEPMQWLHQVAACGACFYALASRLRRDPASPDAVWPAFALLVLALAALSLASATQGARSLASAARVVDVNWASRAGLAKALLVGTVLCAGRAVEPGAGSWWRVTALVGAVATCVLAVAGGLGLGISTLGGLDEPFHFGTSIVAVLLLAGLARMAWLLAHERPAEAGRWRATSLAFSLVVVVLIFGGTSGGEGVRELTALAGAAVIAASASPRLTLVAAARAPAPEQATRLAA